MTDGVRQDSYQALNWMREAAEHGNLSAQKALGAFYLFGLEEMGFGPAEAEKWLSIAVSRGDEESKKLLDEARNAKQSEADDYKWRARNGAAPITAIGTRVTRTSEFGARPLGSGIDPAPIAATCLIR